MKHILFISAVLLMSLSAAMAQIPALRNVTPIIDVPGTEAFYPQSAGRGRYILFTRADHRGLFLWNRNSTSVRTLTGEPGAGYGFEQTPDGNSVIYRSFETKNGRRFYFLIKQEIQTGRQTRLETAERRLTAPIQAADGSVLYLVNGRRKNAATVPGRNKAPEAAVAIRNRHLILLRGANERILDPLGEGIYIWPSLSPAGDKVLFTLGGKGSYVCDLRGNMLAELGYLNAPKWSPDGKWIVGMQDFDDGVRITRSEIAVVRADGTQKTTLTHTPDRVELFPDWGNGVRELLFSDHNGVLYKADLELPGSF